MNRHCNPVADSEQTSIGRSSAAFNLANRLPLRPGWYRLAFTDAQAGEEVELRLDFGLGFIGHHALRARVSSQREVALYVRLFKPLLAVQLVRGGSGNDISEPKIAFERVSVFEVWQRRGREQIHLIRKMSPLRRRARSRHDRPRRLWAWRGLQAFPAALPARGETSYRLWRSVVSPELHVEPTLAPDWLVVMDCRAGRADKVTLEAFTAAAAHANAKTFLLEDSWDSLREAAAGMSWLVLADRDVLMEKACVTRLIGAARAEAAAVYSDNDRRDSNGSRSDPELRTSLSIERLRWQDWLGGVVALRTEILNSPLEETCTAHDLARAAAERFGPSAFVHVPFVLYSRSAMPRSGYAARRFDDLQDWSGKATIIIPVRNHADLLQRCVDSITERTECKHAPEIIVHDNASDDRATLNLLEQLAERPDVRVVRDDLPFNFSRINNEAAEMARGDLLLFLNNDTEVISSDWLQKLGRVASDPSVGCAGPLLLRRDGRIQHAGLVSGPGGIAAHVSDGLLPDEVDPAVPLVRRDVSAVTGACLAIEKRKFMAVGGFDSVGLPVAFNDVDLCLRLESQGLRNVFVPEVRLIHLGSATRDDDDFTSGSDRFRAEFKLMRERWGPRLDSDPFFPEHMRLTKSGPQLRLA